MRPAPDPHPGRHARGGRTIRLIRNSRCLPDHWPSRNMPPSKAALEAKDERRRLAEVTKQTAAIESLYVDSKSESAEASTSDVQRPPHAPTEYLDRDVIAQQKKERLAQAEAARLAEVELRKNAAPSLPATSARSRLMSTQNTAARLEGRAQRQLAARALATGGSIVEQSKIAAAEAGASSVAGTSTLSCRAAISSAPTSSHSRESSALASAGTTAGTTAGTKAGAATQQVALPRRRTPSRRIDSGFHIHRPKAPPPEDFYILEQRLLEKALGSAEAARKLIEQRDAAQGFKLTPRSSKEGSAAAKTRLRVFEAAKGDHTVSPPRQRRGAQEQTEEPARAVVPIQ